MVLLWFVGSTSSSSSSSPESEEIARAGAGFERDEVALLDSFALLLGRGGLKAGAFRFAGIVDRSEGIAMQTNFFFRFMPLVKSKVAVFQGIRYVVCVGQRRIWSNYPFTGSP